MVLCLYFKMCSYILKVNTKYLFIKLYDVWNFLENNPGGVRIQIKFIIPESISVKSE